MPPCPNPDYTEARITVDQLQQQAEAIKETLESRLECLQNALRSYVLDDHLARATYLAGDLIDALESIQERRSLYELSTRALGVED